MPKLLNLEPRINIVKRLEAYTKLILDFEPKNEAMDFFNTGCFALSVSGSIIRTFLKHVASQSDFEDYKDMIIASFDKQIADLQAMKFKPPTNIVKPEFISFEVKND